ncbi:MAG: VWA domain-containing protein [Paludibacteraceae bacterium]|nr:VWA domain-containing protein [Paludibacteraceae bacterium]
MFRFASPEFLYLLIIIPMLIGLHLLDLRRRRGKMDRMGERKLVKQMSPDYSGKRRDLKYILLTVAVLFCILLLARPQFGSKVDTVHRQGAEVIVALDVSNSMNATDIEPSRIEHAKRIVEQLMDKMENDKVGLIVFAGNAYVQIPITSDFVSAKMFMSSISTSMVATQGTAIGAAIDMARNSFGMTGEERKGKVGRSIIVVTDGENHEDDATAAAKRAVGDEIIVNVIGIGSPQGAPVPEEGTQSFKKDANGQTVISKLNEAMCAEIAKAGNGIYVRADGSDHAQKVIGKAIDSIAKSNVESKIYSEYDEQFQWVIVVVLLLLIVELFVSERKNKWFDNIKLFG